MNLTAEQILAAEIREATERYAAASGGRYTAKVEFSESTIQGTLETKIEVITLRGLGT